MYFQKSSNQTYRTSNKTNKTYRTYRIRTQKDLAILFILTSVLSLTTDKMYCFKRNFMENAILIPHVVVNRNLKSLFDFNIGKF